MYFQITFHVADNISFAMGLRIQYPISIFLIWYSEKDTVKYFSSLKQCLQWASRVSLEGQETRPWISRSTWSDSWGQIRAVQPAASSRDRGPLVFDCFSFSDITVAKRSSPSSSSGYLCSNSLLFLFSWPNLSYNLVIF